MILTCTVLLDPQPEGRHSGGMRIREGDESARPGLGVSSRGAAAAKFGKHEAGGGPGGSPRLARPVSTHWSRHPAGSGEPLSVLGEWGQGCSGLAGEGRMV